MREVMIAIMVPDDVDADQIWEIKVAAQEYVNDNFLDEE